MKLQIAITIRSSGFYYFRFEIAATLLRAQWAFFHSMLLKKHCFKSRLIIFHCAIKGQLRWDHFNSDAYQQVGQKDLLSLSVHSNGFSHATQKDHTMMEL